MFDWIDFNHSMKKAHISLGVLLTILLGGTAALFGLDASDGERQAVTAAAFVAAYACLFWLYRREDRARARAEQADRDRQKPMTAQVSFRRRATTEVRRRLATRERHMVGGAS